MPQTRSFAGPGSGEECSVGRVIGSYYGVVSCSRLHSSAAAGEPSRAAAAGGGEAPTADTWSAPPTHSTFFGAKLTLGPAAPSPTASTGGTNVAVARQLRPSCWWGRPRVAQPRGSAGRGFAVNIPG